MKFKITQEQIEALRVEIRLTIDRHVIGGYDEFLQLWKRHRRPTTDVFSDFVDLGVRGWNGFRFWMQVDFQEVYERCNFASTITLGEFMGHINELWIKTTVKMILKDLCEDADGLAY